MATNLESSGILEKLFEFAPDGLFLLDEQAAILRCNAQAERIFGYTRAEMLGQTVEMLVPERFRREHPDRRRSFMTSPQMRRMGSGLELIGQRKDGSEFPVDIQLSPLESAEGARILCVVRDITERKKAEKAVEQSRLRMQGIMDNSPAVIYLKDLDGRFVTVNQKFEELFGVKRESLIGKTDYDLFPKETAECFRANDRQVLEAKKPIEFEEVAPHPDGPRTYFSVKFPICDGNGAPCNVAGISTDITERKRAREALLLEVTNTLVSQLDIRQFLAALSTSLHQVVRFDLAALALFDPATQKLKVQKLTAPFEAEPTGEEMEIDPERSPSGWAFTAREPLVLNRLRDERFDADLLARWARLGLKSGCFLPIISRDRPLGTLTVFRQQEDAWTEKEVALLRQFALQVGVALENALTFSQLTISRGLLEEEKRYLEEELRTEYEFEDIIGESRPLKVVLKQVETVAPTGATVLIQGETGTGKELIARAIHHLSPRRERTFVRLNCAAIPTGLLESELFGHERGAFTGALNQKIGRLELAHHGTLYLDEVGDIPMELQPKLLRALQEREFERLGGTRTIPVDIRLIAATNQNLEQMVQEKRFRSDLYYRLKVFPITLPPLRERSEDVPRLVHYFIEKYSRRLNKQIETIPPEALRALSKWPWPGNIRELENFIERSVILTKGPALNVPISELKLPSEASSEAPLSLEHADREHILKVLREAKGVVGGPQGAAARLGLKRTTLNFKMRKLGISRQDL